MNRFLILLLGIILLAGCSHAPRSEQNFTGDTQLTGLQVTGQVDEPLTQSGSIIHTAIPITGTIEVYYDNPYFEKLKNQTGCIVDTGGMVEGAKRVYCQSIAGYDHVYKIPSLNIEYRYNSEMMLTYISGGYDRFFRKDSIASPIEVSGDTMSWTDNDSYLFKKNKGVNETPEDIFENTNITSGCAPTQLGPWKLFSGNTRYSIPSYRYLGPETVPGYDDRCLRDFPLIGGDMNWVYVFSSDEKSYYYVIGLNGGGNAPPIYTDQSLKLFVE